jgi:hypothetical protein
MYKAFISCFDCVECTCAGGLDELNCCEGSFYWCCKSLKMLGIPGIVSDL